MKRSITTPFLLVLGVAGCTPAVTEEQPAFVRQLIADLAAIPAANSPGGIWKYEYGGRTVYYVPPSCCDVPSILFDADGEVVCGPDGGFTGTGDGRCPDFFARRSGGQQVWDDPRVE